MKSDRPIDAMIAEHVMETDKYWSVRWGGSGYGDFPTYDEAVIHALKIFGDRRAMIIPYWDEPCYSTDISAAWLVVEKMRSVGLWFLLEYEEPPQCCYTSFYVPINESGENGSQGNAYADTAPLSICLAALKAVGVEVDSHK